MAVWLLWEEAEKMDLFTVAVWIGGKGGALGQACAYLAKVLSRIASPLCKELQLVGQKMVNLDRLQISFPSALYGFCISFQICV